ncbi:MAG: hypothetical protein HY749_21100 [Gammaproteobacteria bacterium]|nr:hypothetical protein [Gammaproteobacteria bacterium]
MHITFVKKLIAQGEACGKCTDVETRLERAGLRHLLDEVVIAGERDPDGPGFRLAREHGVARAPFFLIRRDEGSHAVCTIYRQCVKDVAEPLLASL